jgi:hypothetical protein
MEIGNNYNDKDMQYNNHLFQETYLI